MKSPKSEIRVIFRKIAFKINTSLLGVEFDGLLVSVGAVSGSSVLVKYLPAIRTIKYNKMANMCDI